MVLSPPYQPNKFANATEIVGALQQDRLTGIMGELGAKRPMIPVHVKVRSFRKTKAAWSKEKNLNFSVFVQQKWTPFLMSADPVQFHLAADEPYAEETTYRFSGESGVGRPDNIHVLTTCWLPANCPCPLPMVLAGWWGDKFNRLFLNTIAMPETEERRGRRRLAAGAARGHDRDRLDAH